MNSSEIVDLFRKEIGDRAQPYLWEDAEAFSLLDDAQKWFCRKTDGIADSRTAAVCNIAVVPNTEWYATHASILNIRKITRADTGRKIEMLTAEQSDDRQVVFLATVLGPVRYFVLGFEPHFARISPMPNETVTLNLQVYRLPIVDITDIGEQVMEIDVQHHQALTMWMKHRAYDKQDVETFDRRKSDDFEAKFNDYCFKAKQEQARARRVQGSISYGGL